jgi:hypothetical protein
MLAGWGNARNHRWNVAQSQLLVSAFELFEPGVVFIAFATGGFDVEHQVLHIEAELAKGVLHEREDATAAFGALNDAFEGRNQIARVLVGQGVDGGDEAEQVGRQFFDRGSGNSRCLRH